MSEAVLFDHIAFAAPRIADTTDLLVGRLGGKSLGGTPSASFNFWQWSYPGGGIIEVIEPLGPPGGFLHRFLERHGPAIHHVTFKVADLEKMCARAGELGYEVVGYDASSPSWKEAFLHPKQALGVVVQFAESHPELAPGDRRQTEAPAGPQPAGDPVTVVGLRMQCQSEDAALRQWARLIGAQAEKDGELLVFRWPRSPMRLAVEIAPHSAAAPVAVEIGGGAAPQHDFFDATVGARFCLLERLSRAKSA